MTAKELAEKLGRHEKHMYNLFKQQHINTEILEQVAKIFDVKISYFIEEAEENISTNIVSDPAARYGKEDLKEKLISTLERENELLRETIERLKQGGTEQKTKVG